MSVFAVNVIKILNNYKEFLRRNLPAKTSAARIKQLKLKRINIKHAEDVILYKIAQNVVKDIEAYLTAESLSNNHRTGLLYFKQCLNKIFTEYHIEHNKIINARQLASGAIVEAIQLITFSLGKFNSYTLGKLDDCSRIVAKYGNFEQKAMLRSVYEKSYDKNESFFATITQRFVDYSNTFTVSSC